MTALQELKDYIKGNLNTLNHSISIENRDDSYKAIVLISENILEQIDELLEKEKEQITTAYCQGSIDCVLNENLEIFSEQYYKENYE